MVPEAKGRVRGWRKKSRHRLRLEDIFIQIWIVLSMENKKNEDGRLERRNYSSNSMFKAALPVANITSRKGD